MSRRRKPEESVQEGEMYLYRVLVRSLGQFLKNRGFGALCLSKQLIHLNYLFIDFWLYWVLVAMHELSLVAVSEGYSLL